MRGVRHALGVRPVYKTVDTCAAEFAATTPYHYSTYDEETEVAPRERPAVLILGRGPNRIGQGVEFDYSCVHARYRAARRRLRDRHGQLQPRDRLDRLRHLRPALLRAADARGRARGRRTPRRRPGRSPASSSSSAARPRSGWRRRSRTPACRSSARRPRRSTWPRTAARSAGCSPRPACPRRKHGTATSSDEAVGDRRRHRLPGAGAAVATCSAAAAWRSSTTTTTLRGYIEPGHRGQPGAPGAGRPVPRRRDRDRRRRALRRHRAVPRRRHGAHRGGRHPLRRLGLRAAADHARAAPRSTGSARRTEAIAAGVGVRGLLNVQFALAADVLYVLEANPRASRTVPFVVQGDRGAAGQGGGAGRCWARRIADLRAEGMLPADGDGAHLPAGRADLGQGGGAAVQAVPTPRAGRRHRARPGDALDRRGHGHRRRLRHGVRQVARPRRTAAAADQGPGLRLGRQPRQAAR